MVQPQWTRHCSTIRGDTIKKFIITAVLVMATAVLVWLYSKDLGLVGGVLSVAATFIAGEYAYRWGNRKSLENEQHLQDLIDRKKPPKGREN